jgi:membrane protein YqaA with SNARE-associated domain
MDKPRDDHQHLNVKSLLFRTFLFLLIALVGMGLLFLFFDKEIDQASLWLSENLGYGGIFLYTLIVDTFIVPATVDILWPVVETWDTVIVISLLSIASILGGFFGYLIGRYLNHFQFVKDVTASYRDYGEKLIEKYGVWAVVLASLTPIPYSTVSWIAGMLKLDWRHYLIGAAFRIPRLIIYYYFSGVIQDFVEWIAGGQSA